ncbi:MAG: hypothetical protein NW701_17905 [Nitrospira sp.]
MSESILFHPITLPTTDVQATTLWGRAFDWLMAKRNLSLGQFSQLIEKQRNEVRYWRLGGLGKENFGPGVGVLNEILPKVGSSWVEWAGILTQLNIVDQKATDTFKHVESELPENALGDAWCITIPKELGVFSRQEKGKWVAQMKAFPHWKIIRESQLEAEAAMRVLAIQIIRLARSFGVAMNQPFESMPQDNHSTTRPRRGKLVRPS